MYKNKNVEKITYEVCPHCDKEVCIPNNKISNCPSCGKEIIPCSMCEECIVKDGICTVWKVKV